MEKGRQEEPVEYEAWKLSTQLNSIGMSPLSP